MRRRLIQLIDLQRLQRVERDRAALDHADACARVETARKASELAGSEAAALARQWYAGRASRRFEPERDAVLATHLIVAEQQAITTAVIAAATDTEREDRAGAWRLTEARQRATQGIIHDTRRALARTTDEARLDAATARTLDRWRRT